ncbi:MAG: ATP-binding protein [Chloroflexi bacterium]|nr:ATP-binding protein [Chloroflexota bacterium]
MCASAPSTQSMLQEVIRELQRMDELLRARVAELRVNVSDADSAYRGLYISDAEFETLLRRSFGENPLHTSASGRVPLPPGTKPISAWARFLEILQLDSFEADALLLCLLPEIDAKYGRIYAYLQDDVTLKRPTVNLILNLLCPSLSERITARALFTDDAPLIRQRILERALPGDSEAPLLNHCLRVEPFLADYLLSLAPGRLPPHLRLAGEPIATDNLALGVESDGELASLMEGAPLDGLWLHLVADAWSARRAAQTLSASWKSALITTELEADRPLAEQRSLASLARRESLLYQAVLFVRLPEVETGECANALACWADALDGHPLPVIWSNARPNVLPWPQHTPHVARLRQQTPDYAGRLNLWQQALADAPLHADVDITQVAGRYRLRAEQIHQAAQVARHAAWQRQPDTPLIQMNDLFSAARAVSSSQLGQLARRVEPRHRWENLVLPEDRLLQLHELCDQFKYRHVVFDTWGFACNAVRGRGLSALFAGPSGTGKTMAAEVIAGELELDLFKIDLSGVVSKYIGETEKNLERIFSQAEDSNAILFFDEADALFGKRSETKDAHDRYANIEISYLLQKIEEYDGVAILTSNLRQNLDEAFLRRLQFAIEFPFPNEEARLRIWRQTLPQTVPLATDVTLEELAARFKFSGGSIRNVLQSAAFLAARDGGCIGMSHLLRAARREFQKLGKLVDESQFIPSSH